MAVTAAIAVIGAVSTPAPASALGQVVSAVGDDALPTILS